MSNQHTAFVGSIPENYDRYLGPALFEPYAEDLAGRVRVSGTASVLEIACGTGILTRLLRDSLASTVELVATDLNPAMMQYAARKFREGEKVVFKQADAADLPFPDQSFAAAVCQFGLMFVPDKQTALREAHRVLGPGSSFVFNVWDAIEFNEFAYLAHKTVSKFFERDPPKFYEVPFSMHDTEEIVALLKATGFREIDLSLLKLPSNSPSAKELAKGLVEGNPVIGEIRERASASVAEIESALSDKIVARCGDMPVRGLMQAFVCECVR
ncbi:MAG TPA: methyltransferase domain-containing protein [Pyrinomonadaceae bacterium]|nr:methyltransferase domain-containing protein [Pyrinomonadaceae bacterium]